MCTHNTRTCQCLVCFQHVVLFSGPYPRLISFMIIRKLTYHWRWFSLNTTWQTELCSEHLHRNLSGSMDKYEKFVFGATAPCGPGPSHSRDFYITHSSTPQSLGILWTSDQLVAETPSWQHTTLSTDNRPDSRWDSDPKPQQASGHWDRQIIKVLVGIRLRPWANSAVTHTNLIFGMWYISLTATGLTPGGSSTVHIYKQTVYRTTQRNRINRTEHT
jgi:hypothetical protein